MHLDAALNIAWVGLGLILLLAILGTRIYRRLSKRLWLSIVRSLVLAATLFPFVSATDDQIWLDNGPVASDEHQDSQGPVQAKSVLGLYQVADATIVASRVTLVYELTFFLLVVSAFYCSIERTQICISGRSPPASVTA